MGQHRDYFKKEIEKIGEVLSRIVATILRSCTGTEAFKTINNTAKTLKAELHLDLDDILNQEDAATIAVLESKKFSTSNIKAMADALYLLAIKNEGWALNERMRQKALALYKYIVLTDQKTMYFDVAPRIQELER